ncbi:MAG: hypothetical protein E7652_06625 [Ruminococcaceae bacterium]|nr:hypothetical protein [Oscillospiraceae bacterium]
MKKKVLFLGLMVTVMVVLMAMLSISASAASDKGFTYTVENNKATITGYTGSATAIKIPSELGGYDVVAIGREYYLGSNGFTGNTQIISVEIPDTVKSIDQSAFNGCTNLKEVTIGANVEKIGYAAFANCENLETVAFNNNAKLTTIDDNAFSGCIKMTSFVIPHTVKTLGKTSFRHCDLLTEIFIPNSVETIGSSAFLHCDNLAKVVVGSGVKEIPKSCFYDCVNLTSVYFHSTLETIHNAAGEVAFANCTELKYVYYQGNYDAWINIGGSNQSAFNNTFKDENNVITNTEINCDKTTIPFGLDDNEFRFPDVANEKAWYYDEVYYCEDNGYITGTDKGTFNPNGNLTREQFVVILARVSGADLSKYINSKFADVKATAWYAPSVIWANEEGYVNGVGDGTKFGVGQNMTREQLATMFFRYAKANGVNVEGKADLSDFADAAKVGSWAKEACEWAVKSELIGSTSTTAKTLAPQMAVTRGQAAKIFMSYDNIA